MEKSNGLKVDKVLLQTFWDLAESDEKGKIKATQTLLSRLEESQKKHENVSGCNWYFISPDHDRCLRI